MKAARYHRFGDADVLQLDETDRPLPTADEVLVRVAGTSFNPVDGALRAGYLQQVFPVTLPHTPGIDVAGTVEEVGSDVTGFAVGDAVIGFLPMTAAGAAAELVSAPARALTAAPSGIPLADAAALPAVGLTAWQAVEQAGVAAGHRVVINGAGGGVGGYAVQIAKRLGADVIATASPRSAERVRSYGADQVVDHTSTRLVDAVVGPVDVVLDLVGGDAGLVSLVRPGGVFITTVGPAPDAGDRDVRAVAMFVQSDAEQLAELVRLVDAGEIRVDVARRVPLAEIASIHAESLTGSLGGKVVLVPTA